MDDLNITVKEYIRLEEEKAQKRRKMFNWETAKYGKIWYDEDIHDLRSVKTEFPAIAFNDEVSSETLSCEPTVCSLNNEIDFRISFNDSDDEDYTVIFDKNLFSYKKNSTNNLKMDSENDNEKVMPSLPSPEPTIMSEYDEEEQNILYFNDLFPFNIIHPDDLKSEKDNDNNEIDIIQSSEDMALPPRDQRHQYIRYEGLQYTEADIADFELRLARIYRRDVHRVQGQSVFTSRAWRQLFDIRGPLVHELILEFFSTIRFGEAVTDLDTAEAIQLCHRLIACSIAGKSQAPEKVIVTDCFTFRGMGRLDSVNVPYLLARYLRLFAAGRKSGAHISGGQFVARLAKHFGLMTAEILQGLTVIAPELPIIDMAELFDDAAGAPGVAQDALVVDEGVQAIPAPVHAPQQPPALPPPATAKTMPQRMARLEEDVHEILGALA
ncbi:hypothetical protein Tco_0090744 [Tanacetum coccineum]